MTNGDHDHDNDRNPSSRPAAGPPPGPPSEAQPHPTDRAPDSASDGASDGASDRVSGDAETTALLDDFLPAARAVLPVAALWAHGSLASGDYVQGRSDLDLIALLDAPPGPLAARTTADLHRVLGRVHPLARLLHCSYLAPGEYADARLPHLTWAHEEVRHRPVTEVTRRELLGFGRVLYGEPPAAFLPAVSDDQLAEFVLRDLAEYWRPAAASPPRWARSVWVDLGMTTYARATVTLRTGRLITKREALDVLEGELGAPAEVVADIRARRYGGEHRTDLLWLTRRARLTRRFLSEALDATLEKHGRDGPGD